jgi:hypothetical protein
LGLSLLLVDHESGYTLQSWRLLIGENKMANPLIAPVKKYLVKNGFKGISVKNGQGTAWGWVKIDHEIDRPKNCTCVGNYPYCEHCREAINKTSDKIKTASSLAVKIAGLKFYTYTSDDGIGYENDEILVQVGIK